MLTAGTKAPDFTLLDMDGKAHSLSDFAGQRVVLYFYPKDNTAGCTRQACAFRDAQDQMAALNAAVIGISKDSAASHRKFAEKNELNFLLLSDPDHAVMEAYGVWQEKKMCGKVSMGTVRTTFIIDEKGVVEKVMEKVKPDTNAADVAAYLAGK
jgi:peroxiredoxin Q/BCP